MQPQEPPVIDFGRMWPKMPCRPQEIQMRERTSLNNFETHAKNSVSSNSSITTFRAASSSLSSIKARTSSTFPLRPKKNTQKVLNTPTYATLITSKINQGLDIGDFNRGYEHLRAQNFEKRTKGDLKEGFYLGKHLSKNHPLVLAKRFGQGPNNYPVELEDPQAFQHDILRALAWSLDLEDDFFSSFYEEPVATLRLLHYPPQDPATIDTERGIGAHTDFGAVKILLQDQIGGLQVWNSSSTEWVDVTPLPSAYVVNLGNLMMRWTNDRYLSNLHRVINNSGKERFGVPFFFSGNPDYVVQCLPGCLGSGAKYPPITVHQWRTGRLADTFGSGQEKAMGDLRGDVVAEARS
ncbi:oxidoreductase [Penicillium malachiteum]|uniref:Oxidoreductase n=1 Tax=Penicillium malachiteum TaxID=1324776 RepID=A0AAD6HIE0_9EURO|nr:oxidoreductase [Penicillium malachiteum]